MRNRTADGGAVDSAFDLLPSAGFCPVVSISIGDTVRFMFGGTRGCGTTASRASCRGSGPPRWALLGGST